MKKQLIRCLLLYFFLSVGSAGFQPLHADETDPGGGDLRNPDMPAPIDGGLAFLLAAGAGYGLKKYRDAQKGNREQQDDTTGSSPV